MEGPVVYPPAGAERLGCADAAGTNPYAPGQYAGQIVLVARKGLRREQLQAVVARQPLHLRDQLLPPVQDQVLRHAGDRGQLEDRRLLLHKTVEVDFFVPDGVIHVAGRNQRSRRCADDILQATFESQRAPLRPHGTRAEIVLEAGDAGRAGDYA